MSKDQDIKITYTESEFEKKPETKKGKELADALKPFKRNFNPGDMPNRLTEESSFATLFPKYREKYLQETWPLVVKTLKTFGVKAELDLREGSMTVRTTGKTWDPFSILQARDFIKLLSRSVPYPQAIKAFDDDVVVDIIKIGVFVKNKERFVKRRKRLIGPNGQTLKALELVTQCYILVQGNTVSVMGSMNGVKNVRQVVEDCMENIHPIYHIKTLMIRRELEKDENMTAEDWERFIPQFKKNHVPKRTKPILNKKKRTIFPPEQTPRKEDIEMETGEYFLKEEQKKKKQLEERNKKSLEKMKERNIEKEKKYIAPEEDKVRKPLKEESINTNDVVNKLKQSDLNNKNSKRKASEMGGVNDYIVTKKKKDSI